MEARESAAVPRRRSGVDEIQYAKGHKYWALVYHIERGCVRLPRVTVRFAPRRCKLDDVSHQDTGTVAVGVR
jgi:hypothetical protein